MATSSAGNGVAALVLAGGEARRFGSDKTRETLGGLTILERVLESVRPLVDSVTVVGPWAPPGCGRIVEPSPRQGPLAAVAFGVGVVTAEWVLVLGGDHPFLVPELLSMLVARSVELGDAADGVVPVCDGRPEPLVACYRTSSVASAAARLVAAGERRLGALLEEITVDWVDEESWRPVDPQGASFRDVDTPADLDRARGEDGRYS